MSLKEFIAAVKSEGLMTNNRFGVEMAFPFELTKALGTVPSRNILMFCDQAQLPGINLSSSQVRIFGEMQESPYEKLYDPVSLSFLVDNNMRVKTLFDSWMNYIQSGTSRTFRYLDDYSTNININLYDKADKLRYSTTLFKAFPKNINAVSLDYAGRDVMRIQVTFSYKYFANNIITSDGNYQTNYDGHLIDQLQNEWTVFKQDVGMKIDSYLENFDSFQSQYTNNQPAYIPESAYGVIL